MTNKHKKRPLIFIKGLLVLLVGDIDLSSNQIVTFIQNFIDE
jgi:hypothetical protein